MRHSLNIGVRRVGLVVAGTLLVLGMVACGPSPGGDSRTTLVVSNLQGEKWVRNFNPLSGSPDQLWPTIAGVYEPLMILTVFDDEFIPWLATEYWWDDTDQILTFALRPDVRWSDGEVFDAVDVAFTFNYLKQYPELDHNNIWAFLSEVNATDQDHVSFVFQHTYVPGMVYLAHQSIVPEHVWKDVEDPLTFTNENPVTTGPFSEILHFDETLYEIGRNPDYWQPGRPAVESIRVPLFGNNDEAFAALDAGEVDWSGNFIPDIEGFLAKDPEHRGYWFPLTSGPVLLFANTTEPPFDDARVRKAMSMAINREQVVEEAFGAITRPADATALDDGKARYRSEEAVLAGTWTSYDPEGVQRLLEEAGFTRGADGKWCQDGGEPWQFDILVPAGYSDWVQATELIAEQLSAVGISVTASPTPMSEYWDKVQKGHFHLAIGSSHSRSTVYTLYRSLMSSATVRPKGEASTLNWHRCGDSEADALLMAFEMTSEERVQKELMRRIQLRFVELAPAIPILLGPSWGTYDTTHFTGFPNADNPYAPLAPYEAPECLRVLTSLEPRAK